MIGILLAVVVTLGWSERSPGLVMDGTATWYRAGLMESAAARQGYELPPGAVGFAALNRRGDKGRLIWLEFEGQVSGPFLVVDCAQAGAHYETRERQGRIVEVSFEQARKWGMRGPAAVRVWLRRPGRILDFRFWILD